MSIFYGVACLLSLILLGVYFIVDKKRNKYLLGVFIAVSVCNVGYFILSLSKNLPLALVGNAVAYIANIFLPFFMLMLLLRVSNIKCRKSLKYCLLGLGIVMAFITTSGGYLPIYYKSVTLEIVGGGSRLIKEYGILHNLYFVYLFGYLASIISIIIYSLVKKKLNSKLQATFLLVIVFGNILLWLIEQFIDHKFEFLCLSYIINGFLLLIFYGLHQEYERHVEEGKEKEAKLANLSIIDFDYKFSIEEVAIIFEKWEKVNALTKREREVLKYMLLGEKRKDIAVILYISDSTVKNTITSILSKLETKNREELYKTAKNFI